MKIDISNIRLLTFRGENEVLVIHLDWSAQIVPYIQGKEIEAHLYEYQEIKNNLANQIHISFMKLREPYYQEITEEKEND